MNRVFRALLRRVERILMGRRAYKFIVREWVELGDLDAAARVIGTMRFSRNLESVPLDGPVGRRIVVVAPHPDDEMIGPGGTLIRAIRRGAQVTVVYLTRDNGPAGALRRSETEVIARDFGYSTDFLDLPAGSLNVDSKTAQLLGEHIASWRPDSVFVPFVLDDHPEHRAASLLLAESSRAGALDNDLEVWAYQVYTALIPNVVVDITDVHEDKAEAIRMWENSAMRSRDWAHYALGLNAYNSRWLAGSPGEFYAETFFVLPLHEYASLCTRYTMDQES